MQTDVLKTVLMLGVKATSDMTNGIIDLLPEDSGPKLKSAGTSLIRLVHEITGEMLDGESNAEKNGSPQQREIPVE